MNRRPFKPFLDSIMYANEDGDLRYLGQTLTYPQARILDAVETAMVGGGEVQVAGGTRTFNRPSPVRVIILKARQMGVSTLVEGLAFATSMMRARTRCLIASHEQPSAEHLLDMSHRYWDTSWVKAEGIYTPKSSARNRLSWIEPDSEMRVTTAKNVGTGRSHTLHFLHASEVAFWEHADATMSGLRLPRRPLTFQFLESTANGFGNYFKRTWDSAVSEKSSILPLFYPWWQHHTYNADYIGLGHLADRPLLNLDDEERALSRAFSRMGLDDRDIRSKLIWRREMIESDYGGDLDWFHQEMPATPEEAFVSTGRNVFNPRHLSAAYEPEHGTRGELHRTRGRVEFKEDRDGPLTIFRHPAPTGWYMVGGDAAKQARGDYAVACVLDRLTWEQVAEWRADVDPVTFAEQLILIGEYYNTAMLVPETNMSGGATAEIVRSQYENVYIHQSDETVRGQMASQYGFNTNVRTKPEAIGHVKRALLDKANDGTGLTIHSRHLYGEMSAYVLTDTGQYQNAGGEEIAEHDDTVMALALALTATVQRADDEDRPVPTRHGKRPRSDAELQARRVAAVVDSSMAPRSNVETEEVWDDEMDDWVEEKKMTMAVDVPAAYDQDDVDAMEWQSWQEEDDLW